MTGAAGRGDVGARTVAIVPAGPIVVDDFEQASAWSAHPSEGVSLALGSDDGLHGRALRLDVRFTRGTGYAVARRAVSLDLPADYVFRFRVRGELPVNHLEFKLVDSTGQNVWWHVRRDLEFPRQWQVFRSRRRQIRFAWGPAGGGELRHVAFIEFAVTAGAGGSGSVWIDDLELEPLAPDSTAPRIAARASSSTVGHEPARALEGRGWWSAKGDTVPWFALDLGAPREIGGLTLDWEPRRFLANYVVELSLDGHEWFPGDTVRGGNGGSDPIALPETETRQVRVRALGPPAAGVIALRRVQLESVEWSATPEAFFGALAGRLPRGSLPRPYVGEQCLWAVVGLDGGREEALLSEDGTLETGKRMPSIEPFVSVAGRLLTWADVAAESYLEGGDLPIPTVRWRHPPIELTVTAVAIGDTAHPGVLARYRVRNLGGHPLRATLFLALRPFQVNPPWQNVGAAGGVARITSVARSGSVVRVNREHGFVSLAEPSDFGATSFDQGEIVEHLRQGRLPPGDSAADRRGLASAALAYPLRIEPGASREVDLIVPLREPPDPSWSRIRPEEAQASAIRAWRSKLDRPVLALPPSAREVVETLRAQLGWILVNRDGAAIQPGSRNYDRSWIRDGSLTSSALLRLGQPEVVRDFIEWFAPFQYENGKVPCCADARGPDPVTENDSHGQFLWLIAEYYRFTGDRALVEQMWPRVKATVAHLDSLRAGRRAAAWRTPEQERFFGLLLPSISHEGYANPVHSYWDDFFAYRGYQDAVYLAAVLGHEAERARYAASRDTFAGDLARSVRATMVFHHLDYVPGSAELGDFDATSTTVALSPTEAADLLPEAAVRRTFERYWEFFRDRRDGHLRWDAFTPYETRVIGCFARLGWRDRAHQALSYFLAHRRPSGWRQWPEVEYRDPRAPKYLGDLPHTWVGSDFVRSVLDLLVYERGRDSTLVVGAGVPLAWVTEGEGLHVRGLPTSRGALEYTMRARGVALEVVLEAGPRPPPGGILVLPPARRPFRSAQVNGAPTTLTRDGGVLLRSLPARITLRP
ncbi:MAG TPA: discoidin domain-containing protein [Candidatus Eisenbacteria bacterium]